MWESGQWMDTAYAVCTLGGARCKHQVLRHNLEEIQQWPSISKLPCHVHDPQEWTPYTCDGQRVYTSVPIQGGGRVHSSSGVCHRGVSQLVCSSKGPGYVAGAENASISLNWALGALA